MKRFLSLIILLLLTLPARATWFYIQGFQSDSPAITNQAGVSYWPQTDSPFVVYGTKIIYGGNIVTITPDANGTATNFLYPGTYRFYFTNLNAAFIAVIPDSAVTNSLALYITNLAVFPGISMNS